MCIRDRGNATLDSAEYTLYRNGTAVKTYTIQNGSFTTDSYPCTESDAVYTLKAFSYTHLPTGASMTTEEDERYTALISDLSTYMAEHVLKFVTGEEDMGQYPDFVATLYEMGMQEAIDLKQAAYDRYMAR